MVVYSELPVQDFPTSQLPAQELPAHNYFVPIPPSYERHPSFPLQKGLEFEPRNSDESNQFKVIETTEAMWKLKMKRNIGLLFRFLLFNSKEYTRILAILVMTASFLLVVTPLIIYAKAQKKPNDFDTFPKISPITTKPCILFAGVATMNFLISVLLLAFSLLSSKVRLYLPQSNFVRSRPNRRKPV
ncbi:hypothetical protein HI914_05608 [Erysiphe necator]|nr:hypothetical protein HI914_05608 [Erysiphe necator]